MYPAFKKLLQGKTDYNSKTMKDGLCFVWSKMLNHDDSIRKDLIKEKGYMFFLHELYRNDDISRILLSTFIIAQLADYKRDNLLGNEILASYKEEKKSKLRKGEKLLGHLLKNLTHPIHGIRQWSALCVAKLWENSNDLKILGIEMKIVETLLGLLNENMPEVRAAALHALGTFFGGKHEKEDISFAAMDLSIARNCAKVFDGSPLVRMELIRVLSKLIFLQRNEFAEIIQRFRDEAKEQRNHRKSIPLTTQANNATLARNSRTSFSQSQNQKIPVTPQQTTKGIVVPQSTGLMESETDLAYSLGAQSSFSQTKDDVSLFLNVVCFFFFFFLSFGIKQNKKKKKQKKCN
ncbi:hypothetical protein RFI_10110 [Reticulomyxa filosa]|uniref:Condensin complex subunit 1 C-terminal domain-containing protein n=1 Tax=Reticulomyxa filosa TaxID=46433 RepID=X6NLY9_RETFI|nr:hypothetical protein RFI_10110 [Reticulomyxa filosa]|eukprot:ETO27021.1 hypothetical protein RFI_10110 [Reticulomyxa filosa]